MPKIFFSHTIQPARNDLNNFLKKLSDKNHKFINATLIPIKDSNEIDSENQTSPKESGEALLNNEEKALPTINNLRQHLLERKSFRGI